MRPAAIMLRQMFSRLAMNDESPVVKTETHSQSPPPTSFSSSLSPPPSAPSSSHRSETRGVTAGGLCCPTPRRVASPRALASRSKEVDTLLLGERQHGGRHVDQRGVGDISGTRMKSRPQQIMGPGSRSVSSLAPTHAVAPRPRLKSHSNLVPLLMCHLATSAATASHAAGPGGGPTSPQQVGFPGMPITTNCASPLLPPNASIKTHRTMAAPRVISFYSSPSTSSSTAPRGSIMNGGALKGMMPSPPTRSQNPMHQRLQEQEEQRLYYDQPPHHPTVVHVSNDGTMKQWGQREVPPQESVQWMQEERQHHHGHHHHHHQPQPQQQHSTTYVHQQYYNNYNCDIHNYGGVSNKGGASSSSSSSSSTPQGDGRMMMYPSTSASTAFSSSC